MSAITRRRVLVALAVKIYDDARADPSSFGDADEYAAWLEEQLDQPHTVYLGQRSGAQSWTTQIEGVTIGAAERQHMRELVDQCFAGTITD